MSARHIGMGDLADEIRLQVRSYILRELLPGESPGSLADDTPLISGGIVDSITTLKFVMFLEKTFKVCFEAHEMGREHFETVDAIVETVRSKL